MWHPDVDACPITCGNFTDREESGKFPGAVNVSARKELYVKTVESHLNIPVRGNAANNWTRSIWIKHIQKSHLADIVKFLEELRGHKPRSIDLVRNLTLDPQGIIRIKTSLCNCLNVTYDHKFPILLPNNSPFSNLIVAREPSHFSNLIRARGPSHLSNSIIAREPKLGTGIGFQKSPRLFKSVLNICEVCKYGRCSHCCIPVSPELPCIGGYLGFKRLRGKFLPTLVQLMSVTSCARTVLNKRLLCVVDSDDTNTVSFTGNSTTLGRNSGQVGHSNPGSNEADFNPTSAKCLELNKKLRDTFKSVHRHWVSEYLSFLARKDADRQKGSPHTKSLIPKLNNWVLVNHNSNNLRLGKLIKTEDREYKWNLSCY